MNWPTPQDYNEAIQNPQSAFADAELRTGTPVLDALGLPRPITGQFASVYKLDCGARSWAVRCFLRNVPGQQARYEAISAHLAKTGLPYFVSFEYLSNGIHVRGQPYPILKMAWVQGESLATYVSKRLDQPAALAQLANRWAEMMRVLQKAGIAHGDLQHGNVLIVNGELRLVDYDGMFVPPLAGQTSQELGHRHYQHPTRSAADFDASIDNFSAWVIYLSLMVLSAEPELWQRFAGGDETLLFRRADFEHPDQSRLIAALTQLPGDRLQASLYAFRMMLSMDLADVPALGTQTRWTPSSLVQWIGDYLRPDAAKPVLGQTPVPHSSEAPYQATTPAAATNGTASVPEWVADHAPVNPPQRQSSPVARQSAPAQPASVTSPSPSITLVPLFFQRSVMPARTAMLGSGGALAVLMAFAATAVLPIQTMGLAVAGVLAVNLLFQLWQFWRDPVVPARVKVEVQVEAQQNKVHALETQAKRLRRKREQAASQHEKREADVDARRNRVHDEEQRRLMALNETHQARTAPLLKEQQHLRQQEADARRSVQQTLGPKLSALQRELGGLGQAEKDELARRLREQQDQFVKNALFKFGVIDANIPTLDRVQRMRLVVAGIVSAGDVDARVGAVSGMQPARTAAVLAWRQSLETHARLVAPKALAPREAEQIRKQFERRRGDLEKQRRELEATRQKQEQAVKAQFVGRLSKLNALLSTLNQRHDQDTRQARTRATDEVGELDARLFDAQKGSLPKLQRLDADLTALQQELDQWREQLRQSHDLLETTYRDVQFGTYMQWVLGLKRRP